MHLAIIFSSWTAAKRLHNTYLRMTTVSYLVTSFSLFAFTQCTRKLNTHLYIMPTSISICTSQPLQCLLMVKTASVQQLAKLYMYQCVINFVCLLIVTQLHGSNQDRVWYGEDEQLCENILLLPPDTIDRGKLKMINVNTEAFRRNG